MSDPAPRAPRARHRGPAGRLLPAIWLSGAAAAVIVVLGVSGTLSSWTSAIITNDTDTVASANAVILKETGPGAVTCQSSDAGVSNSYTCSTINKYGGVASPLGPGQSQSVAVTMANVGTVSGALTLKAGACTSTGGLTTGAVNACGIVQVAVVCPTGTATYPTTGTATLADFAAATTASVATLARDATVVCTFTVSMPATASPVYAGQTLSQSLVWTLS